MVASGPLQATARSATGAPKSITDSRDGTLGRSELLPHQRDIVAIIVAGGPPVQEGLVAPSDAPELEPLKLPSRMASFATAPVMTARESAAAGFVFDRLRQQLAAKQCCLSQGVQRRPGASRSLSR